MSSMNIGGVDALRSAELRRVEARAAQIKADLMRSEADRAFRRAEDAAASGGDAPAVEHAEAGTASAVDVYA